MQARVRQACTVVEPPWVTRNNAFELLHADDPDVLEKSDLAGEFPEQESGPDQRPFSSKHFPLKAKGMGPPVRCSLALVLDFLQSSFRGVRVERILSGPSFNDFSEPSTGVIPVLVAPIRLRDLIPKALKMRAPWKSGLEFRECFQHLRHILLIVSLQAVYFTVPSQFAPTEECETSYADRRSPLDPSPETPESRDRTS
jgi:hypothetical protein